MVLCVPTSFCGNRHFSVDQEETIDYTAASFYLIASDGVLYDERIAKVQIPNRTDSLDFCELYYL